MRKRDFISRFKNMKKDIKDGYYGFDELIDECWSYVQEEQWRNKDLWKEVKKLRKKLGIEV